MKKRQWAIVAGLGVLVISFLLKDFLGATPNEKPSRRAQASQGVETIVVENGPVPVFVEIDGSLTAVNKIDLFAEVNGILQPGSKRFEEGVSYEKGQTLLQLENSEARAAYQTAKNQFISTLTRALPDVKLDYPDYYPRWREYLNQVTAEGQSPPPTLPDNDQLRLFLTSQGVYRDYQNLESTRIRLNKYRIQAPFDGVVTEAMVEEGTLVRPGQRFGEFMAPGLFEMTATVSSNEVNLIKVGDSVHLTSADRPGQWIGKVFRKNAKVDPTTLRVKVFIRVKSSELSDGLFLNGRIRGRQIENAVQLPRNLIFEKNSLYVVQDTVLQKKSVQIVHKSAQSVVAQGLPNGTQIPIKPVPGAYPGMPVKIINP